ncbi:MAG TPA: hypothetical protein PKA64_16175, partial [Myxococcota bacterium]|nr:hypothetical protein [Myxococcota bacterium]
GQFLDVQAPQQGDEGEGLLAGGMMLVAVAAVVWALWGSRPAPPAPVEAPPPPAPRVVELTVPADVAVWLDGARVSLTGTTTQLTLAPGPHAAAIGVGPGCAGEPEAGPCCAITPAPLDLPAGEAPFPWAPPAPPPLARVVQFKMGGPGAAAAQVWVDEQPVGNVDGLAESTLPVGSHAWRLEVGACPEKARGCLAASVCPAGCVSHVQPIEVQCGDGPQRITVDVPAPLAGKEPTPPAPNTEPNKKQKPKADPQQQQQQPAQVVEQRLVVDVSVNAKAIDKAGPETQVVQAGMAAKAGSMKACFESYLGGKSSDPKVVTVEFRTDRSGVVDAASVKVVGSSGAGQVDACVTAAVKAAKFSGTRKPGMGKVAVRFAAELM